MKASNRLRLFLLVASFGALSLPALAQGDQVQIEDRTLDRIAFPSFKVIGNVYYVGTVTLSSFLINTPAGNILINSNYEDTMPLLRTAIEKVGFRMEDTKILLASHAHPDHQQADAMFKQMTGATVMAMEQDVPALQNMKPGDKPHPIDRVLKDGDTVTLGGTTLTAHFTPGHTRGCTTWTMKAAEGGQTYDVVILCGGVQDNLTVINNKNYPQILDDYTRTFKTLRSLPCDIFLGAHSWFYNLTGKYTKLGKGPNPYIDAAGYKKYVEEMEKMVNTLADEQRKKAAATPAD